MLCNFLYALFTSENLDAAIPATNMTSATTTINSRNPRTPKGFNHHASSGVDIVFVGA